MKRLSWRTILQRVEGQRIVGLWHGVEDGYLRIELDDGSLLPVAASREGVHVVADTAPDPRRSRLFRVVPRRAYRRVFELFPLVI